MSFGPNVRGGGMWKRNSTGNSYGVFEEQRPYWKDLLLATLPAFIGSVLPIVVGHMLTSPEASKSGGDKPAGNLEKEGQKPEQKPSDTPKNKIGFR